jgi:hypothetical protein
MSRFAIFTFLVSFSGFAQAQFWSPRDALQSVKVVTDLPTFPGYGQQILSDIIPDETGGAVMFWYEYSGRLEDRPRMQRLGQRGEKLWTDNGYPVIDFDYNSNPLQVLRSPKGDFVVFHFAHDANLRGNRFNLNGQPQWGPLGKIMYPDYTQIGLIHTPQTAGIAPDGSGFYLYYLTDTYPSSPEQAILQKFDWNGNPVWPGFGKHFLTSNGTFGAIMFQFRNNGEIFIGANSFETSIRFQHLDANGNKLLGDFGLNVSSIGGQFLRGMAPDGQGGFIFTWFQRASVLTGNDDSTYGQRVDRNGNWLWNPLGQRLLPLGYYLMSSLPDGEGGMWLHGWSGHNDTENLWTQRINRNGNQVFPSIVPVCNAPHRQAMARMTLTDPANPRKSGVNLAWCDWRNGIMNQDIYWQRITHSGRMQQPIDGAPFTNPVGVQGDNWSMETTSDNAGRYFVVWENTIDQAIRDLYCDSIPVHGR